MKNCQIEKRIKYFIMNLEAGFQFIIFLLLFGFSNYLMMLKRYENKLKKRRLLQMNRIASLYPKGTFVSL